MSIQSTLSIIKPDAVRLKQADIICQRFIQAQLKITASKKNYQLTQQEAEQFYSDHKGKPFFEGLIESMIAGPIDIQVLEGENAIERYRALMGPTDPQKATIGTLRYEFGSKILPMNAVHGSDSLESARREIHFFFEDYPATCTIA